MKLIRAIPVIALLLLGSGHSFSQDFTNLDFGSAVIVPIGASSQIIDFSQAFPGWTGYIGTNVATEALYFTTYLDSSGISIYGEPGVGYEAILQAGFALNSPGTSLATTLLQTGLIPVGTQSLLFYGLVSGQSNSFSVTLNGQTLSLIPVSTSTNSVFTLFGANINAWAGQTATLAFTVFPQHPHTEDNYLNLGGIQFSDSPVPEPGPIALLCALVGLSLAWRRRKSSSN